MEPLPDEPQRYKRPVRRIDKTPYQRAPDWGSAPF